MGFVVVLDWLTIGNRASTRNRSKGAGACGNPEWGKLPTPGPALPTEFDLQVRRLELSSAEYIQSAELRRWCERNRNRVYVPEWLLEAWGMHVDAITGSFA
jgi:hypothetical protein